MLVHSMDAHMRIIYDKYTQIHMRAASMIRISH